jgi:acyl carrier protein
MASTDLDTGTNARSSQTLSPGVADTLAKVRALLQERYGVDNATIEMETGLGSLGLDSLSLVECAFDLEKSLSVALSDLPHELSTIGDLVYYVSEVRARTEREAPKPNVTK